MPRRILFALVIVVLAVLLGWFVLSTNKPGSRFAVKLGLDLAGGTELIYKADTSNVVGSVDDALASLQQVIEHRVNLFGVAEPLVQVEYAGGLSGQSENRLLVDLPGVTNVQAAVNAIGQTPVLEFELVGTSTSPAFSNASSSQQTLVPTGLTGGYVTNAQLQFSTGNGTVGVNEPIVVLNFNSQGAKMFADITSQNVGRTLAVVLDGQPISEPVIQEAIPDGQAQITGNFTPDQAKQLVDNLNFGALPVPISLESSDTVGPTLGSQAFHAGLVAGMVGFALVALFMILWYRLPGVLASIALVVYLLITVAIIKVVPITLTASGIAGFIISIGMAVDANVLIFERFKEEVKSGKGIRDAVNIGFGRAWPAIRDGHLTMLISAVILFWLGTSIVQGFALVFGFGVVASLISAVFISRVFMLAVLPRDTKGAWRFLVGSGFMGMKSVPEVTASEQPAKKSK